MVTRESLLSLGLVVWVMGCSSGDAPATRTSSSSTPSAAKASKKVSTSSDAGSGSGFGNSDAMLTAPRMTDPQNGLSATTCARAEITVDRIRPRVVFLVDSSSSMSEDLGGTSRWDALRGALLGTGGLILTLQDLVKFGLVTFEGPRYTTCPAYRYAAPAPSNYKLIDAAFPAAPPLDSSTPTGASMNWAIDNAFLDQVPGPDVVWEPQFMIFATDGEPNGCANGSTKDLPLTFDEVIAAAHKASGRGIKIFVISLAAASGQFADHLSQVAKIGGTDTVYSPQNKADLVGALETIIGSAISCDLKLNAGQVIEGSECKGEVTLNSKALECKGDDGWELVDPTHLRLKGKACQDFKLTSSASVAASFPCEATR